MAWLDKAAGGFNSGMNRLSGLFGTDPIPEGGVMGEPQIQQLYNPKLAMATQLLAGSAPGSNFGEIMAKALMAGQQARQMQAQQIQQQKQAQLDDEFKQAQIQRLNTPEPEKYTVTAGSDGKPVFTPNSQLATATPYMDPASNALPANVAEAQWYASASPELRAIYDKQNGREQAPYFQVVQRVMPDGSTQQGVFDARSGKTEWDQAVVPAGQRARVDASGRAIGEAEGAQAGKAPAKASMDYVLSAFRKQLPSTAQGMITGRAGVFDYADATRFDNLREQLSTELRTVFRIPGEGTLSDQEMKQYGLQLPNRTNPGMVNRAILDDIEARVAARMNTPIAGGGGGWKIEPVQ